MEPGDESPRDLDYKPQKAVHAPLAAYLGLRCRQHMDTASKKWLFGCIH